MIVWDQQMEETFYQVNCRNGRHIAAVSDE